MFHLHGSCHSNDVPLKSHCPRSSLQPSSRFGTEPWIVAAHAVVDDVISMTKAAVDNSPTQGACRRGKADDQEILLCTNDKRRIHSRCFNRRVIIPPRQAATKLRANSGFEPKCKCI